MFCCCFVVVLVNVGYSLICVVFFPFERERTTFTSALMLYHQTRVPLDIWEEVDDLPIGNIQFFAFRTVSEFTLRSSFH